MLTFLYCYKLEDCSIHFMHWNVKCDDFFLRALLCLLPWVIFYVIYSAEHQCEHVMQCSVKNIYIKAINSTVISALTEQPYLIFLPFDFWKS